MDLQDVLPALQVGELHRHPPVKPAGPGEGGVQGLGPVGGGQNDDAVVALKAVHLGEQLVEGLLPLVIAAVSARVALLADGVDLVDEDDTGRLLLGLLEEVPHLGGTHAHEHLHKFRAGHGEEGDVGLAGHGLGQHGLAGARRAHQQDALGHGGADLPVLSGVVEVVDHLLEALLGLILSGHVGELDALGGFDIDLGVGFAEHQGVGSAHLVHHPLGDILPQRHKDHDGQNPVEQRAQQRVGLLDDLAGKLGARVLEGLHQVGIGYHAGLVDGGLIRVGEEDLVLRLLHLDLADLLVLRHLQKGVVVHLLDLPLGDPGHGQEIEEQQDEQHDDIVVDQRFFRGLYFIHSLFLPFRGLLLENSTFLL